MGSPSSSRCSPRIAGFVYAYIVRFRAGRYGPLLLFIVLITLFGGYLMKIYAWKTILGNEGVLNRALMPSGIIDQPITSLLYSPPAVVITLIHFLLPFAVLPIYASMRGITDIEIEAARDLGAGRWRDPERHHRAALPARHHRAFVFCFLIAARRLRHAAAGRRQDDDDRQSDRAAVRRSTFNWPLGSAMSFVVLAAALAVVALAHGRAVARGGRDERRRPTPSGASVGALFVVFLLAPLVLVILFSFTDRAITNFPDRRACRCAGGGDGWRPAVLAGLLEQPDHRRRVGVISAVVGTMAAMGFAALPPRRVRHRHRAALPAADAAAAGARRVAARPSTSASA